MKLIGSLTSPYVRKVRVALAEKKIDYEFEIMSPWDASTRVPEFSPLGKVPVLILDDKTHLFDSRVIVEYIDTASPVNKLIPSPNRDRAEVKRWEALADGINDAAAAVLLEQRRPTRLQSPDWIRRQQGKVAGGLRFMENELNLAPDNPWCTGLNFSLADIAVGCALGFLGFRFPGWQWAAEHPILARLYAKQSLRPSFSETVPHD